MSATAPRITQANPDMRPLGVALFALTLGVGLLVAVTVSRPDTAATVDTQAAAPVVHDHGWIESTYSNPATLHDHGWSESSYAKGPDLAGSVNAARPRALIIEVEGGGISYTGIPYPAPGDAGTGGSKGPRVTPQ